jgi:zinc protease
MASAAASRSIAVERLPNGVEVVVKENHFSPTVAVQVWVRAGSLHEEPDQRGMAHFLEHMLFKGTAKRAVGEIASTVEECGGDINAYTTFDQTVYYLTLASPHVAVGVDILADAISSSSFDATELERERKVILEEIRRSNDNPGGRVGRRVFEMIYEGTEAGRPILGSEASVAGFSRDGIVGFYKKWYRPDNMTVIVVGDVTRERALALVREAFGAMPAPKTALPAQPPMKRVPGATGPRASVLRGDWKQPRVELVFPAPPLEHADTPALDLAAFALGSGEMARLTRRVRDGEGIAASVHASVYSPHFGGIFELSALPSEDAVIACVRALTREAALIANGESITDDELARARANLRSDRVSRDETVDGQARALGYGMLTSQKLVHDDVYTAMINAMPPAAVDDAARRWLDPRRAVVVALVPKASTLSEAELVAAITDGWADGRDGTRGTAWSQGAGARTDEMEVERQTFSPGLTGLYRQNPQAQMFTLTLATEGGLRDESAETAGINNAMASLLAMASKDRSFEELVGFVEARGASMEGFSGKDSLGIHLQCLPEFASEMLAALKDCLLEPVFPEEQWTSLKREIEQAIVAQDDSPAGVCMRRFQEMIFGAHPYRFPLMGTLASVEAMTAESLQTAFLKRRDAGPWVVAAAGPMPAADAFALIGTALSAFRPSAKRRQFASAELKGKGPGGALKVPKDREQSHVVYGFPGLTWGDGDRAALDVLVNVLGGHGGRLFMELRDREGLAYTVAPIVSYGCDPGAIGAYIACAPDKVMRAMEGLKESIERLAHEAPTQAELQRAINHIVGTHDMGLQKSDSLTTTMALMEIYGCGYDDYRRYPKEIAKVTRDDVVRVARRITASQVLAEVVVGPGPA